LEIEILACVKLLEGSVLQPKSGTGSRKQMSPHSLPGSRRGTGILDVCRRRVSGQIQFKSDFPGMTFRHGERPCNQVSM
jgi:hypothetical protein